MTFRPPQLCPRPDETSGGEGPPVCSCPFIFSSNLCFFRASFMSSSPIFGLGSEPEGSLWTIFDEAE